MIMPWHFSGNIGTSMKKVGNFTYQM